MFTNNYYKALCAIHSGKSLTLTDMAGNGRTSGTTAMNIALTSSNASFSSMRNLRTILKADQCGVIIGTGTAAPTPNDTMLSGQMITTFNGTAVVAASDVDGGQEVTATYTITNSGSAAFTIGEIGLFGNFTNASTSATGGSYCILIERTVLASPVTIEPGAVGQVTYTIRVNYPTA